MEGSEYIKVEDGFLLMKFKLSSGTPSSSGKSLVVASTNGFVPVADSNYKVSVNVIAPRK